MLFFVTPQNFVFVIFWYQLYCGFSGTVMIDQIYLMFFNLFFTSLPPLAMGSSLYNQSFISIFHCRLSIITIACIVRFKGIYDQSAPADMLLSQPGLYAVGRESQLYRSHSFWVNIIDALYQSTVIFFITYCVIV